MLSTHLIKFGTTFQTNVFLTIFLRNCRLNRQSGRTKNIFALNINKEIYLIDLLHIINRTKNWTWQLLITTDSNNNNTDDDDDDDDDNDDDNNNNNNNNNSNYGVNKYINNTNIMENINT